MDVANMAHYESRIQALAGGESGPARVHTCGKEDSCWKLSRAGMGCVSGTLCSMITQSKTVSAFYLSESGSEVAICLNDPLPMTNSHHNAF